MRRYDDLTKVKGKQVPGLAHYQIHLTAVAI